jgi:D-arabinose 1-dehydrogenase-like Zn-dependent alcohol dehydrogenase
MSPQDALVEITHGSICGSDNFYLRSPQVLGHESVGIVKEVGSEVQNVKVGDRVGLGYVQKTCGECQNCKTGMK